MCPFRSGRRLGQDLSDLALALDTLKAEQLGLCLLPSYLEPSIVREHEFLDRMEFRLKAEIDQHEVLAVQVRGGCPS